MTTYRPTPHKMSKVEKMRKPDTDGEKPNYIVARSDGQQQKCVTHHEDLSLIHI